MDEEKTETIEKIKNHLSENKKTYIVGGVCLVIGATSAWILSKGEVSLTNDSWKLIDFKWKSPTTNNIMQTVLERRGHPGNVIRCIETGKKFASQNQAAKEMNLNAGSLSSHLNGKYPTVQGFTFECLGEAVNAA